MLRRALDLTEAGRLRAHARARENAGAQAWLRGGAQEGDGHVGDETPPAPLVTQGGRSPRPERPFRDERRWLRTPRE
jgi:hypothetical protein